MEELEDKIRRVLIKQLEEINEIIEEIEDHPYGEYLLEVSVALHDAYNCLDLKG